MLAAFAYNVDGLSPWPLVALLLSYNGALKAFSPPENEVHAGPSKDRNVSWIFSLPGERCTRGLLIRAFQTPPHQRRRKAMGSAKRLREIWVNVGLQSPQSGPGVSGW